jgi:hypothetical protein
MQGGVKMIVTSTPRRDLERSWMGALHELLVEQPDATGAELGSRAWLHRLAPVYVVAGVVLIIGWTLWRMSVLWGGRKMVASEGDAAAGKAETVMETARVRRAALLAGYEY